MPLRPPAGYIYPGYEPFKVPNAPTIGTATDAQTGTAVSVAFTAPSNIGGAAITAYYAVSNPGQITATGASSPISVTGLTSGTPYTFTVWALNSFGPSPYSAASNSATPTLPPMGLFAGGSTGSDYRAQTYYINISTTGNATSFGNLSVGRDGAAGCGSTTRAIVGGGRTNGSTRSNIIDFATFASTGSFSDFGDLTNGVFALASANSATRGLFFGGSTTNDSSGRVTAIDYITIASAGNAISFGSLGSDTYAFSGCSSPTRAVVGGGSNPSGITDDALYVTIASTGNTTFFGNLTTPQYFNAACSNSTRGVFAAGFAPDLGGASTNLGYITIASTGNALTFGQLTVARFNLCGLASSTRGVFAGGSGNFNVIDYITIASTGNATDFGDLPVQEYGIASCSSNNGGVQ